jgi:predicted ABC-type ATPase
MVESDNGIASKTLRTALVVSGPPGVGKTTVGWRVFDRCTDAGGDPAFVDVDMLGAAWPAPDDDPHQTRLRARNLAAVWANCQAVGSRHLIMADVVESGTDRERLAASVGMPVIVCTLLASSAALETRIRGRGRDHGPGMDKLIKRAATLSSQLAAADMTGFAVDTDGRSVDDIADEVLMRWESSSQ